MPTPESRGRARLRRVAWRAPRYQNIKQESFEVGQEIVIPPLVGNPMQGYRAGRLRVHPVGDLAAPPDSPLLWLDLREEKAFTRENMKRWIRLVCAFGTREEVSSGPELACDLRGSKLAPGDPAEKRRTRGGEVLEKDREVEPPEDHVFRKLFLDADSEENSAFDLAGYHIRLTRTGDGNLAVVVESEPSVKAARGAPVDL
jgi:hypothetical protein